MLRLNTVHGILCQSTSLAKCHSYPHDPSPNLLSLSLSIYLSLSLYFSPISAKAIMFCYGNYMLLAICCHQMSYDLCFRHSSGAGWTTATRYYWDYPFVISVIYNLSRMQMTNSLVEYSEWILSSMYCVIISIGCQSWRELNSRMGIWIYLAINGLLNWKNFCSCEAFLFWVETKHPSWNL